MRPVSVEFQEAARQPVREDRIEGYLGLWDSETVFHSYKFDEDYIVQGSLTITDQMPGGKFGFGGAYTRNMEIKFDIDVFADNYDNFEHSLINLTDGEIALFYYLTLEDGSEERVFLGQFFINPERSSRKFNVLSVIAEDGLIKLDTPATALPSQNVYTVYRVACAGIRGEPPNTQAFIEGLPNGQVSLTYDTSQIQTNRDVLMWLGELTGTFLRECRDEWDFNPRSPVFDSPLGRPELVQIPTKYTQSGTVGSFNLELFKEDNGSIIPADVRFSTDFSDTSIRITHWKTDFNGKKIVVDRSWNILADTLEGTIELSSNPLLEDITESTAKTYLTNIADYGEELHFGTFKVTFNGNPAIEVGDYVYLEPGGSIDETEYHHCGIVTYYKWRFRGKCEIRCATDAVASYTRPKGDESGVSLLSARAADAPSCTNPKSQLEKRVDALGSSLTGAGKITMALTPSYSATKQLLVNVAGQSFLNVNAGNTYLQQPAPGGGVITTTINASGIKYQRSGGSWGASVNLLIEPLEKGFAISNNEQVLKVDNGILYINGRVIS